MIIDRYIKLQDVVGDTIVAAHHSEPFYASGTSASGMWYFDYDFIVIASMRHIDRVT